MSISRWVERRADEHHEQQQGRMGVMSISRWVDRLCGRADEHHGIAGEDGCHEHQQVGKGISGRADEHHEHQQLMSIMSISTKGWAS